MSKHVSEEQHRVMKEAAKQLAKRISVAKGERPVRQKQIETEGEFTGSHYEGDF